MEFRSHSSGGQKSKSKVSLRLGQNPQLSSTAPRHSWIPVATMDLHLPSLQDPSLLPCALSLKISASSCENTGHVVLGSVYELTPMSLTISAKTINKDGHSHRCQGLECHHFLLEYRISLQQVGGMCSENTYFQSSRSSTANASHVDQAPLNKSSYEAISKIRANCSEGSIVLSLRPACPGSGNSPLIIFSLCLSLLFQKESNVHKPLYFKGLYCNCEPSHPTQCKTPMRSLGGSLGTEVQQGSAFSTGGEECIECTVSQLEPLTAYIKCSCQLVPIPSLCVFTPHMGEAIFFISQSTQIQCPQERQILLKTTRIRKAS